MEDKREDAGGPFLDTAKRNTAYTGNTEAVSELLGLVDLYLAVLEQERARRGTQAGTPCLTQAWEYLEGRAFAGGESEIPFWRFCASERLGRLQILCLALGLACAVDGKYEGIFGGMPENAGFWEPQRGTALLLYQLGGRITGGEFWQLRQKEGFFGLCFLEQPETEVHWMRRPLRLRPELLDFFLDDAPEGESAVPEGMGAVRWRPVGAAAELRCPELLAGVLRRFSEAYRKGTQTVLCGEKGSGKRLLVRLLAGMEGRPVLFTEAGRFQAAYEKNGEELLRRILLEQKLYGTILCICCPSEAGEEKKRSGEELLERLLELSLCCVQTEQREGGWWSAGAFFEQTVLHIPAPSGAQRASLWREGFADGMGESPAPAGLGTLCRELGRRYALSAGQILEAARMTAEDFQARKRETALSDQTAPGEENARLLRQAAKYVRELVPMELEGYARRIKEAYRWDDLVVEEETERGLRRAAEQMRCRTVVGEEWGFDGKHPYGNGVCMLFYGPPGTGKTMAAQVMAGELGLELYRVDLSKMNSKYIGETQKNISALFSRARAGGVLLFFDEADAFFSRRTQVRDANDRHANAEIAHLLQELESYEGVTILATNLKENMDEAFRRRVRIEIPFLMPGAACRARLWRRLLPEKTPREEPLKLEEFAERFEVSGSEIREILQNAAYRAAAEGCGLGNRHIAEAVSDCFRKYGQILGEKEFEFLSDSVKREEKQDGYKGASL